MPPNALILLLLAVILATGITLWLISLAGPATMLAALPAFAIVAVAVRVLGR